MTSTNFIKIEAHFLHAGDTVLRPSEDGEAMRAAKIGYVDRSTMGVVRLCLFLSEGRSQAWVVGNADKVFADLAEAR